jgi:hypothetical protein
MSEEYDLNQSCNKLGKLVPILKDAHGNIIDGFHRIEVDPKWITVTIDTIDDPVKLELARLAVNFCRRNVGSDELKRRIGFLIEAGLKVEDIADKTGISKTTIYKYMPQQFKDPIQVEAGKKGAEIKQELYECKPTHAEQTVKTQDIPPSLPDFVECERCHTATSTPKTWHGHKLCQPCAEKANLNPEGTDGYFRYLDKKNHNQIPSILPKVTNDNHEPIDPVPMVECPFCGKRFALNGKDAPL